MDETKTQGFGGLQQGLNELSKMIHRVLAERDALRAENRELRDLARGADHLFLGEKYYGDDQVALWQERYRALLGRTAEMASG